MAERPLALVTGASAGIGEAMARVIAADGYDLVLLARRTDRLEALKASLPGTVHVMGLDLADRDAGPTLVDWLEARGLRVDVLVNNAGFGVCDVFARTPPEQLTAMADVNMRAVVDLTRRLLPPMLEAGRGGVLNVASLGSYLPGPNLAVYYASKAFVLSFSEAVSEECRGTGVTISALCPGPTDSEFAKVAAMENSRLFRFSARMSAERVAEIGWRGFVRGRRVVVPGLSNKLGAVLSQATPHALLLPITRFLQSAKA